MSSAKAMQRKLCMRYKLRGSRSVMRAMSCTPCVRDAIYVMQGLCSKQTRRCRPRRASGRAWG
eukprot:370760-Pyramimonas_sp.AAC.1